MYPVITLARQAGTRFTYPERMKGWVDAGYVKRWFTFAQTVTHPSTNQPIAIQMEVETMIAGPMLLLQMQKITVNSFVQKRFFSWQFLYFWCYKVQSLLSTWFVHILVLGCLAVHIVCCGNGRHSNVRLHLKHCCWTSDTHQHRSVYFLLRTRAYEISAIHISP